MAWRAPQEFGRRALDLVAEGKSVAEVARLLEVSDQSICAAQRGVAWCSSATPPRPRIQWGDRRRVLGLS
jgi:hypothetical protein